MSGWGETDQENPHTAEVLKWGPTRAVTAERCKEKFWKEYSTVRKEEYNRDAGLIDEFDQPIQDAVLTCHEE